METLASIYSFSSCHGDWNKRKHLPNKFLQRKRKKPRSNLGSGPINFRDSHIVGFMIHVVQRRFAMRDLFWLKKEQLALINPVFPLARWGPRGDDRCVVSGTILVIKNGLHWRDAPTEYGPHKTLYNSVQTLEQDGYFRYYIHSPGCIRRTKGGLNSKLHAIVDGHGHPLMMCLTAGQTSDHIARPCINNAIRSKLCSVGSKIGAGSQHDMTVVLTLSSRPYSSQLSLYTGFNES